MKVLFSCLLVSLSLLATPAKAGSSTIVAQENMPYAFSGSWYDRAQSGQGFDVQTFSVAGDNSQYVAVYWYTFDTLGSQKIWLVGVGTINGNSVTVPLAQAFGGPNASGDGYFNRNTPNGITNKQVGTLTMTVSDCNTGTISWNFAGPFDGVVTGGMASGSDSTGSVNVARLTPGTELLGQNLCSTPLSNFDPSNNDSAYWEGQYNSCESDLASDDAEISTLLAQVNGLQEQAFEAYNNGYSDGYSAGDSDGYSSGYSDGDSAGYSDGYTSGYSDGYTDGYNDGSNSCDSTDGVKGKKLASTGIHNPPIALLLAKVKAHAAAMSSKIPARAAQKAPFIPANKNTQLSQSLKQISQELQKLKAHMDAMKVMKAAAKTK